MEIGDEVGSFDLEVVLQWCFEIQSERIRRGLLYEAASQKLLPNLHREILAFAKIAQLASSKSQRTSSQTDGAGSSAGPPRQHEVREEIRTLDPEDRRILREVLEEIGLNIVQPKVRNVDRKTVNLEEHIDDEKKSDVE